MISFKDIEKNFSGFSLSLNDIAFKEGDIVGLVGNNGAGKTTLLKLILDLLKSDKGEIKNNGRLVNKNEDWKLNTGAYLDEDFLIPYLSPIEYFLLIKSLKKIDDQVFDNFLTSLDSFIGDLAHSSKYVGQLSKGNKQKVGIIGALIGNLKLVILDEPFSNLDPSSSEFLINYFLKSRNENKITLVSSHSLNHLMRFCNRIVLLEEGRVILDEINLDLAATELASFFKKESWL